MGKSQSQQKLKRCADPWILRLQDRDRDNYRDHVCVGSSGNSES